MTIDKLDPTWAESGAKTPAPSDEKIEIGLVGGEKVPIEYWNWLQDRVEKKLNKIQTERIDSFYEDATDPQLMLTTGLWDESWGSTGDAANTISSSATKGFIDMCVYFTSDNEPRLLVLDVVNDTLTSPAYVEVWDPRTLTKIDTSQDLTLDLPLGGGEIWEGMSMCTDGTHVYITFQEYNAYPNCPQRIHSWDIATWTENTGWTAGGTLLPNTGISSVAGFPDAVVIIASATRLATLNTWNVAAAATDELVSIINISTGAIVASGAGDCTTGSAIQALGGICSDGTNVFFSTYKAGINTLVCSATIANPQVGCGGANYPLGLGAVLKGRIMCSCGPNMIISCPTNDGQTTETDNIFRTHNAIDADLDILNLGQDAGVPTSGDQTHLLNMTGMCFDGLHLWIMGEVDNTAAGGNMVLAKIDIAKLSLTDTDIERYMTDVIESVYYINPGAVAAATKKMMPCVFDGRDIWCVFDNRVTQTYSGNIYRLPLALFRS